MSQYYENSKYISSLFFVMLYTYILDDSIKSPTLILTADHLTVLFLPAFSFLVESKELQMLLCPKTKGSRGHILFRMDQDLRIISEVKVETAAPLGLK